MPSDGHAMLMAKVCHYYYRDQLTMQQIGKRLNISRQRVGRLLKEAVDIGFVRIEIPSSANSGTELERKLGLKASLVVQVIPEFGAKEIKRMTCEAGASFLRELFGGNATIGIGWGSTTFELVNHMAPVSLPDATVVQITGGNKKLPIQFDCHEVTRRLAQKLNVEPVLLHAPGIVDTPETRQLLMRDSTIAETFRLYEKIDLAIVGIGAVSDNVRSTLVDSGYVSDPELESLRKAGAVGDVFSYFIDDDGKVVRTEIYDRLITIGLSCIRKVPLTVGIATGAEKAQAVAAAVRGGFVNALIVDSLLAKALLERPALEACSPT
jgi:DNA-binding transcriptional regulator LsrR (DeoR family)